MSQRANAVKPDYKPIRNTELEPVGLFYKGKLTQPGVQALFTAKDASIDAAWVTDFGDAITAVGNIVPSRTIIQTNRDITLSIKLNSKKSVLYGKVLAYYLKKAFPNQPGLVASFPILQANKKMRNGETEGFLFEVNIIIEQLTVAANQSALLAKGWTMDNLTDYTNLKTSVSALNVQQELAKQLVPENTDAATVIRNECYGFIDTLVKLKDIVYDTDKQKKHDWAVKTILNQIRSGAAGGGGNTPDTISKEGSVAMGVTAGVDTSDINTTDDTMVETVITNNGLGISASPTLDGGPGPLQWFPGVGTFNKTLAEFGALIGADAMNKYIKVFNPGPGTGNYKITFTELE